MGLSSDEGGLLPVCGSADGYVESLDPLAGKEEAARAKALRGRKKNLRQSAHISNHTWPAAA
jgi:hypothetical protein